ncbi:MAG: GNAT family N-acetyltransferase [Actinomycetota bacterium]
MTGEVRVREARPEEVGVAGEVTVAAYSEYAERLGPDSWASYSAELADVAGRAVDAIVLVVEADREIVGALAYYPPWWPARPSCEDALPASGYGRRWPVGWAAIRALGIHPAHRGRGYGRLLTMECVRRAREAGAEAVGLHTVQSLMRNAVRMYEGLGFERRPEFDFQGPTFLVPAYAFPLAGARAQAS